LAIDRKRDGVGHQRVIVFVENLVLMEWRRYPVSHHAVHLQFSVEVAGDTVACETGIVEVDGRDTCHHTTFGAERDIKRVAADPGAA
jgi:hypothetical protein